MAGPEPTTIRIDLRAALPVAALGLVVLVIIFVELCGREDVEPLAATTPFVEGPTSTPAPTFTPGPSPTTGPEQATATRESAVAGADRDEVRLADLNRIADALEEYAAEHDEYPSTGGGIQSLCAFEEFDVGCELRDVLESIPADPFGNAAQNGYWYESDGSRYTVYGQRESELFPACDEHPQHLRDFNSVMCVRGP
jgi:hypothetical protein